MTSLIIIRGDQDTGKTTIANGVVKWLREEATAVRYFNQQGAEVCQLEEDNTDRPSDFYAVVTIRRQTFAIISGGDTRKKVKDGIEWGCRMRVDGIIQCVRDTNPAIIGYVDTLRNNAPRIDYQTHKYQKGDPMINQEHNIIIKKVVECILQP